MLATWGCTTFPKPTIDLQFAGATSLDNRITFTRASTATFFNSAGVLTSAAVDVARFDYNPSTLAPRGLLIEEARTNICLQSEDLSTTWTTQAAIVSANAAVALDGTLTADKVAATSTSGFHGVNQQISVASGTTYTFSVFAKAAGNNFLRVSLSSARFGSNVAYFNLATGAIGTVTGVTAAIVDAGNNWYRCSVTGTCISSGNSTHSLIYTSQSDNQNQYTGDNVSGLIAWGAQFEAGAFPTSYIPTTTTALTRSADVASMTGTNFSSWFNASEGTIFTQATGVNNIAVETRRYLEINDNTANERFVVGYEFTTAARFLVTDGGATQADISVTTTTGGVSVKMAAAYKVNDFQQASNGTLGTADTSGTLPTVDRMFIGQAETTAAATMLNGYIQRIAYYPTRLANAQLQALTA